MSLNHITKAEYPDVFNDLFAFEAGETCREHRRASNFYVKTLIEFDAENLPQHPKLHGLWETGVYVTDTEHGRCDDPDELFRVEKWVRTVEQTGYERVKD